MTIRLQRGKCNLILARMYCTLKRYVEVHCLEPISFVIIIIPLKFVLCYDPPPPGRSTLQWGTLLIAGANDLAEFLISQNIITRSSDRVWPSYFADLGSTMSCSTVNHSCPVNYWQLLLSLIRKFHHRVDHQILSDIGRKDFVPSKTNYTPSNDGHIL